MNAPAVRKSEADAFSVDSEFARLIPPLSEDERLRQRSRQLLTIDPGTVGFVYFIQRGDDGPIKIGWTRRIETRLRELQTGNAERLTLRALVACTRSYETLIHKILAPCRMSGEWFARNSVVVGLIESHQKKFSGDPDLLRFVEALDRTHER